MIHAGAPARRVRRNSVTKLQAAASAVTGAESTVDFSYSCFVPRQARDGQALAQLSGVLLAPCVVVAASLDIWAASGATDWHENPMNGRDGGGLRGCARSAITLSTVSNDGGGRLAALLAAAGTPGLESRHVLLGISPFQLYGHTLAITHSGNTDVRRASSTVTYLGVKKRLSATVSH
ncbi:hypothetical protein GPECTOR_31g384 [Gonium pectorale]|uniref:Uncharacterized protein n=1 Tax=Gonium pectorale TaxID=33097 RepID=A0A150GFB7_GONPE|nr:hypothetical protein GPECTOR_31g384 [Gonium pectorale]|eukprot:KXZ48020.1 hypothetical protein GPECTOR_31g384 [Gonium pectorale]